MEGGRRSERGQKFFSTAVGPSKIPPTAPPPFPFDGKKTPQTVHLGKGGVLHFTHKAKIRTEILSKKKDDSH